MVKFHDNEIIFDNRLRERDFGDFILKKKDKEFIPILENFDKYNH